MKIFVTSSVFCILIAIFSVKAKFISQSIDKDTISLGGMAARVKRAANSKNVNQLFRALSNAFEQIKGRPRHQAWLGTANDFPTEIQEGGMMEFNLKIANPLLKKADLVMQQYRSDKSSWRNSRSMKFGIYPYDKLVQKQPSGYRYKEGLRRKDAPGCGVPLCTIVDMRIKSFKSMCHLTEWMTQHAKYQQVFEIQKGSCENASKYLKKFHQ